jgi:hypothetical protein
MSTAVEGFRDDHLPGAGSEIRNSNIENLNPFKGLKTHNVLWHQATESV